MHLPFLVSSELLSQVNIAFSQRLFYFACIELIMWLFCPWFCLCAGSHLLICICSNILAS
jgi:hypothetical protein